jgi:hypothetical protein
LLKLKLSDRSAFNRPISLGITPVKLLLPRFSVLGKALRMRY